VEYLFWGTLENLRILGFNLRIWDCLAQDWEIGTLDFNFPKG